MCEAVAECSCYKHENVIPRFFADEFHLSLSKRVMMISTCTVHMSSFLLGSDQVDSALHPNTDWLYLRGAEHRVGGRGVPPGLLHTRQYHQRPDRPGQLLVKIHYTKKLQIKKLISFTEAEQLSDLDGSSSLYSDF